MTWRNRSIQNWTPLTPEIMRASRSTDHGRRFRLTGQLEPAALHATHGQANKRPATSNYIRPSNWSATPDGLDTIAKQAERRGIDMISTNQLITFPPTQQCLWFDLKSLPRSPVAQHLERFANAKSAPRKHCKVENPFGGETN